MSGWHITDNYIQDTTLGLLLGGGRRNKVLRNKLSGVTTGIWLLPSGLTSEKGDCQEQGKRVKELLYPGSPWGRQYPELKNITTDHMCAFLVCCDPGRTTKWY